MKESNFVLLYYSSSGSIALCKVWPWKKQLIKPSQQSSWVTTVISKKESSAKDPEWLCFLLSFTSRKSISMLCRMIQDAVCAVVTFHRHATWGLFFFFLKKGRIFSQTWPIPQNLLYACISFSLPQIPIYLFQKKTDKFWYAFPCMLNSPSLALFPMFLPSL